MQQVLGMGTVDLSTLHKLELPQVVILVALKWVVSTPLCRTGEVNVFHRLKYSHKIRLLKPPSVA